MKIIFRFCEMHTIQYILHYIFKMGKWLVLNGLFEYVLLLINIITYTIWKFRQERTKSSSIDYLFWVRVKL